MNMRTSRYILKGDFRVRHEHDLKHVEKYKVLVRFRDGESARINPADLAWGKFYWSTHEATSKKP